MKKEIVKESLKLLLYVMELVVVVVGLVYMLTR